MPNAASKVVRPSRADARDGVKSFVRWRDEAASSESNMRRSVVLGALVGVCTAVRVPCPTHNGPRRWRGSVSRREIRPWRPTAVGSTADHLDFVGGDSPQTCRETPCTNKLLVVDERPTRHRFNLFAHPVATCKNRPDSVLSRAYFYAWVSASDTALLSHFLRWYVSLGLPLSTVGRARIILHGNASEPTASGREASMGILKSVLGVQAYDANVVWSTEAFSAPAKTKRANAQFAVFLGCLPTHGVGAEVGLIEMV